METINWNDFEKVEDFPEAQKPAYKITADFGSEIGIKKSSARITDIYKKEDLINKKIIGVVNFLPKQIGPFVSEFLCAGFYREDGSVVLAVPDKDISNGSKLG